MLGNYPKKRLCAGCLLVGILISFSVTSHAAITPQQREQISALASQTRQAGQLFTEGKFKECAEQINAIQSGLSSLMPGAEPALQRQVKPIYSRLQRAHAMLELEGVSIDPLPAWKELLAPRRMEGEAAAESGLVSFKDTIAPMLVDSCGSCHINNRRGNFSVASYQELMRGINGNVVLFPGGSKGSRIVEVIETGDMPRGGRNVSDEQLDELRLWIDQGAKFDGENPTANLNTFVNSNRGNRPRTEVKRATGNETVSFALDVAPILTENCNGCHIGGRRASGGLRMDTFSQFLRGGDSGEVVAGRNATESLLIKKLKGQEGNRMPAGGRPPLSDEQITLISTWIREGATFDGSDPGTDIGTVVSEAWAAEAEHSELFARRSERAEARWKRVLPDRAPETTKTGELLLLGDVSPSRLASSRESLLSSISQAKDLLKLPEDQPLIRGGLAVYVLNSRYDYSEFGRMTEKRELPRDWYGHWQADPLDVYGVLSFDKDVEDDQVQAVMLQVVVGAYFGAFRDVPSWFAEGVARNLVRQNFRRSDSRIATWQQALPVALQRVKSVKSLQDGSLDEEAAGLVGMGLTNYMLTQRRGFEQLHKHLREGKSFNEASMLTFGPTEEFLKKMLGRRK